MGKIRVVFLFFFSPEVLFLSEVLVRGYVSFHFLSGLGGIGCDLQKLKHSAAGGLLIFAPELLQSFIWLLPSDIYTKKSQGHGVQPQDCSVTVWYSPFGLVFRVTLWPGFGRSSKQPFYHKCLLV